MFKIKRKSELPDKLPVHIAIKMDGNGRWAQKRHLPRKAGHAVGAENFKKMVRYCKRIGIPYLTVYAFSTENWKRPKEEVDAIMKLFSDYLLEAIDVMEEDGVNLTFLGDLSILSESLKEKIRKTREISTHYEGIHVQICINYGSRDEIRRAAVQFAAECKAGDSSPEDLSEELFSKYLDTRGIPDPDLVIHPGGETRISNFLLWQSAYAEYYFTDVLWPDFSEKELNRALWSYVGRDRRFGGLSDKSVK